MLKRRCPGFVLAGLVTGLVLGLFTCGTILAEPAESPACLRVVTYNIHHGLGTDGTLDLPRIAKVICRLKPDIVALQEVDNQTGRSHGVDQATELGRLTGMHSVFAKAMDYDGGQYGEAILSRHPIVGTENHPLPFDEGREPRVALAVRIRGDGELEEYVFVGTHLEHADTALRLRQARHLHECLTQKGSQPTILAGDLNAVPTSPPMQFLRKHWASASNDAPEPTWPSEKPRIKIDYILWQPANAWHVAEVRVIDEPVASDHCPLLVVLDVGVVRSGQ